MKRKHKHQNTIELYRERIGLSTAGVAHLLGHSNSATFSDYERCNRLPSLENALRLGVILRVPVEFLFGKLYQHLRTEVRRQEERLKGNATREVSIKTYRL